jgi:hypothetical protein
MPTPDLSALTSSFVERGPAIFTKSVLGWDLRGQGIQVRTNVNAPQAMTRLSAVGNPRPYTAADALTTGPKFTDRTLTAFQSKWDFDFDAEEFRNTYLASDTSAPFYEASLAHVSEAFLDDITRNTLYLGSRNASGTTSAAIATGWGTDIAALVTATTLTPIVTGAISDTTGVDKFELMVAGVPTWMRQKGFIIYCSFAKFDNFRKDYRTRYGFNFDKNIVGQYKLDNLNVEIRPVAWMGTSARLIATVENNLVYGTDLERVQVAASQRRNIIEVRLMMPVGMAIQDTEAIFVNDVA